MKFTPWKERALYFLLGALLVFGTLFLTGAISSQSQIGRYRISAWTRGQFVGAMIVDTTTGVVKYVDRTNEKLPFDQIK